MLAMYSGQEGRTYLMCTNGTCGTMRDGHTVTSEQTPEVYSLQGAMDTFTKTGER